MKRPLHNRLFALLWAIAFVLGTAGDGFGLHPCPHHSGGTHETAEFGNGTHQHHSATAEGEAGAGPVEHAEHGGPGSDHSGPCTCGSACQAGSGIALPGPEISGPTLEVAEGPTAAIVQTGLPVVDRPAYFLPFALAPPA